MSAADKPEPPPTKGKIKILPLVIEDIKKRGEMGIKKYGTPLMTGNGRDAMMDAYQEGLDLVMYLKQAILERNTMKPFYLVWNGNRSVSTANHRHETRDSAEAEAERLARMNPGETFYVLAALGRCESVTVNWDRVGCEIPF